MLDFERPLGGDAELQDAVAAEAGRPGRGGQFGTDYRGPVCLKTGEKAAIPGDDWGRDPGHRAAERAQAGPALALRRSAG